MWVAKFDSDINWNSFSKSWYQKARKMKKSHKIQHVYHFLWFLGHWIQLDFTLTLISKLRHMGKRRVTKMRVTVSFKNGVSGFNLYVNLNPISKLLPVWSRRGGKKVSITTYILFLQGWKYRDVFFTSI